MPVIVKGSIQVIPADPAYAMSATLTKDPRDLPHGVIAAADHQLHTLGKSKCCIRWRNVHGQQRIYAIAMGRGRADTHLRVAVPV